MYCLDVFSFSFFFLWLVVFPHCSLFLFFLFHQVKLSPPSQASNLLQTFNLRKYVKQRRIYFAVLYESQVSEFDIGSIFAPLYDPTRLAQSYSYPLQQFALPLHLLLKLQDYEPKRTIFTKSGID